MVEYQKVSEADVIKIIAINATMQAQWQRGTEWAAGHAKRMYEEIKALADAGHAAVPNEKYRLMWLGRGLWHDFAFYQNFEQKYGAAFVWSMYLAMGADAYIRNGFEKDPLRALAARYIGMEDFLHMPPWNSGWFVREAKNNRIDGVVYMAPANCMQAVEGSFFIRKTLEDAGIPYVGAGRTIEQAESPVYLQARGFKIAYVAASRAEYTIYTPEATDTKLRRPWPGWGRKSGRWSVR